MHEQCELPYPARWKLSTLPILLAGFEPDSVYTYVHTFIDKKIEQLSYRDSLTVSALACHAADPSSNPAQGDDFFN